MDLTDQYNDVIAAINGRSNWESKVSSYYTARFDGIPRTRKPYNNAPDVHYPLIDTVIDKLKPFYAQQLYGDLVIASFVAEQAQMARDQVSSAEQWFDYKMRQCSNFESEIINAVDMMLHYGICPIKVYWDEAEGRLAFEAIDPMYVIVPQGTDRKPEWLVHVKVMSRSAYESNPLYTQGNDFINQIVGRGTNQGQTSTKEQVQAQREGLTFASEKSKVVLWEIYTPTANGIRVDTIAPVMGGEGVVREPFELPYKNAAGDKTIMPFVCLRNESTTKGWYSSRGVAEILLAHELSLSKSCNSKLQFLDFFGHPVYKNDGLAPINASSFQASPGRILPQGVEPVQAPSAPIDFEEEMQFVRALAEDRIQIPDLAAGQHLSGRRGAKGEITATQVNAVIGLSNQSNDLRSRLFRQQLGEIYNQAFYLSKQNAGDELSYINDGGVTALPNELLNKRYTIHPSGSADSWNKAYKIQDATMTYQLLLGKPNVNQDELLNYFLETKDPRLAKRLFMDSGMTAAIEDEKQAMELLLMEKGHSAVVKPNDRDAVHLTNMGQWLQAKMAGGEQIPPQTAKLVFDHAQGHAMAAKQKQDKEALGLVKQMGPAMQLLQGIMSQGGMGTPEAGAQGSQVAAQPNGQKESISINYKDAPDSIKRQMEIAAGFHPAVGELGPDEKKLAVDAITKTHSTVATAHVAANRPAPKPSGK
jgi:hypothetical protein